MAAWACNGEHFLFFPLQLPHTQRIAYVMVDGNWMIIWWRIIETLLYLERRVFGTCTRTDHAFLSSTTGIQPVSCCVTSGQDLIRISTALPAIPESEQLFIHSHYCSPKWCQKIYKGMQSSTSVGFISSENVGFCHIKCFRCKRSIVKCLVKTQYSISRHLTCEDG